MSLVVGSARIDESGHISGGKPGDQTGNEVSTQAYYVHSKGWYCLRPKSITEQMPLRKLCCRDAETTISDIARGTEAM